MMDNRKLKNNKHKPTAAHGVPMADDECRDWDSIDSLDEELGEEEDEGTGKEKGE